MSSGVQAEFFDAPNGDRPASTSNEIRPSERAIWLSLVGAALPYATVALGWWIADLAFQSRDDLTRETASDWVYAAIAAAVVIGILLTVPLLRCIRSVGHILLALFIGIAYLFGLAVVDFIAYVSSGAPFP